MTVENNTNNYRPQHKIKSRSITQNLSKKIQYMTQKAHYQAITQPNNELKMSKF